MLYSDKKVGLVSTLYDIIYVRPKFDQIIDFGIGYYYIFIKNGIKGLINRQGKFIKEEDFISMPSEEQIKQQFLFSTTYMDYYEQMDLIHTEPMKKNSSAHKVPFFKRTVDTISWFD